MSAVERPAPVPRELGAGRLDGRVALVTGASSGIGAAAARALAGEGARVALMARRPEPLARLAEELGEGALALPADVADGAAVAAAVDAAAERLGGLDVVVNSAGVSKPVALADLDAQEWRRTIDVDLTGAFHVARAAGLRMAANGGGSIVNVSSSLSTMGMGMYTAYCAAKAGVDGLTRALAAELAPHVRVNAVCPGPVQTPMLDAEFALQPPSAREEALGAIPLKRFATAEEVAAAVLYVAVDATYMTGTALLLDGGLSTIA